MQCNDRQNRLDGCYSKTNGLPRDANCQGLSCNRIQLVLLYHICNACNQSCAISHQIGSLLCLYSLSPTTLETSSDLEFSSTWILLSYLRLYSNAECFLLTISLCICSCHHLSQVIPLLNFSIINVFRCKWIIFIYQCKIMRFIVHSKKLNAPLI